MQVNMSEASSNLSNLGKLAWQGEEVIIAKAGKPFLRLTPYDEPKASEPKNEQLKRRPLGMLEGQIWIAPDFDDTPEELIDLFYNGDVFPEETSEFSEGSNESLQLSVISIDADYEGVR